MDVFPADAAAVALARAVAGDAMVDLFEAAELLDVGVNEFAGIFTLVAADWLGRLQGRQPVEAEALQNTADRCRRDTGLGGNLLAGPALTAQSLDLGDDSVRRRPVEPMRRATGDPAAPRRLRP